MPNSSSTDLWINRKFVDDFIDEVIGDLFVNKLVIEVPTQAESLGDLFDRRLPYSGNDVSSKLVLSDTLEK